MKQYSLLVAWNLLNLEDIDKRIDAIINEYQVTTPEIIKWLKNNLKEYLVNKYDKVTQVTPKTLKKYIKMYTPKFINNIPNWIAKGVENNSLYISNMSSDIKLKEDIIGIIRFFKNLDRRELGKLQKIPFEIALKKSEDYEIWMLKKDNSNIDENGLTLVHDFGDGVVWYRIRTKAELHKDGEIQNICTKDGRYDYKVANNESYIFSLRDKGNRQCNIELLKNNTIEQIKGYKDGPVKSKYWKYVRWFLDNPYFKKPYILIKDLKNIGYVEINEEWMNPYTLPKGLTVDGSLKLINLPHLTLPDNLTVTYNVDIQNSSIKELPKGLYIGGTLYLFKTKIKTLPEDMVLRGSLTLNGTMVSSLPKNFKLGGTLNLNNSLIKELPKGLNVGRILYLSDCDVSTIPDDVTVGETINCFNSPITYIGNNLKVGEYLSMEGSKIKSMGNNITVGKCLGLAETPIESIGENLIVGGTLNLNNSLIKELPKNMTVGEKLILVNTQVEELPTDLKAKVVYISKKVEKPKGVERIEYI